MVDAEQGGNALDFSPAEVARIRIVVDDWAGNYYGQSGGLGIFGREDTVRSVADGHLEDLHGPHGRQAVWDAVTAEIDRNPDALTHRWSQTQIDDRAAARESEARRLAEEARQAFRAGDTDRASQLVDLAEQQAPALLPYGAYREGILLDVFYRKEIRNLITARKDRLDQGAPSPAMGEESSQLTVTPTRSDVAANETLTDVILPDQIHIDALAAQLAAEFPDREEQLDELVDHAVSLRATDINNGGVYAQVAYLLTLGETEDSLRTLLAAHDARLEDLNRTDAEPLQIRSRSEAPGVTVDDPLTNLTLPDGALRIWEMGAGVNDFGRMYVLDVHGVNISAHERDDGTAVIIDREADSPPTAHPNLLVRVNNSGETDYGPPNQAVDPPAGPEPQLSPVLESSQVRDLMATVRAESHSLDDMEADYQQHQEGYEWDRGELESSLYRIRDAAVGLVEVLDQLRYDAINAEFLRHTQGVPRESGLLSEALQSPGPTTSADQAIPMTVEEFYGKHQAWLASHLPDPTATGQTEIRSAPVHETSHSLAHTFEPAVSPTDSTEPQPPTSTGDPLTRTPRLNPSAGSRPVRRPAPVPPPIAPRPPSRGPAR